MANHENQVANQTMIFKLSKSLRNSILSIVLLCIIYTTGNSQTIQLVKDIWTEPSSEKALNPKNLTKLGDIIYFTAYGNELWQTDLTYEGTHPVDLGDGKTIEHASALFVFKDKLYFSLDGYFYITDGTLDGTRPILDSSDAPLYYPSLYYEADDLLYFHGNSTDGIRKLFRTDGTSSGTFSLAPSSHYIEDRYKPVHINNQFYFSQTDPKDSFGFVLWATDGTVENTRVITNSISMFGVNRNPSNLVNFKDELYYICEGDSSNYELWKTNGQQDETKRIKIFKPNRYYGKVTGLIVFNDLLYFNGSDSNSSNDVWRSDGTTTGTLPISKTSDIYGPEFKGVLNNKLFFTVFGSGRSNMFYIDGLSGEIEFFLKIDQRPKYEEDFFYIWNGDAYFPVLDDAYNAHLWTSDGTPEGTVLLSDIPSIRGNNPRELVGTSTDLAFVVESVLFGPSLWKTKGSRNDTSPVYFDSCCTGSSYPEDLTKHDQSLVFIARDYKSGVQLWTLEGKKDPVKITFDANDDYSPLTSYTQILGSTGTRLFYIATDTSNERRLWLKESISTQPIRIIPHGQSGYVDLKSFGVSNGIFFYSANDLTGRNNLQVVSSASSIPKSIEIQKHLNTRIRIENITAYNGGILFTLNDFTGNQELWFSDGTSAGTKYLKNLCLSPCYVGQVNFTFLHGLAYFVGYNLNGVELWVTDGTLSGTKIAVDINKGLNSSQLSQLAKYKNQLVFIATDGSSGPSFYSSNGTPDGTKRHFSLMEIDPKIVSINLLSATADYLYFSSSDQGVAAKLWQTNMSVETTMMIRDLQGQNGSSLISDYSAYNNQFYFSSEHIGYGTELFVSDKANGTRLVEDLYEGERGSFPRNFLQMHDKLYFTATDDQIGTELFYISSESKPQVDNNQITVFPNPTNDRINVVWKTNSNVYSSPTKVDIFDVLGHKVYTNISNEQIPEIEVLDLTNGLYILRVNNSLTAKFVKF